MPFQKPGVRPRHPQQPTLHLGMVSGAQMPPKLGQHAGPLSFVNTSTAVLSSFLHALSYGFSSGHVWM